MYYRSFGRKAGGHSVTPNLAGLIPQLVPNITGAFLCPCACVSRQASEEKHACGGNIPPVLFLSEGGHWDSFTRLRVDPMNHFLMWIFFFFFDLAHNSNHPLLTCLLIPSSPGSDSRSHPQVSDSHFLHGGKRGSLCAAHA